MPYLLVCLAVQTWIR